VESVLLKGSRDYIRVNRRHWNAIAERARSGKAKMLKQIRDGAPYFEKWEPKIAPHLRNIKGKKIIVPQFGDGLVMLACAKEGAMVTGVDFSREQVRFAREAATYCGVDVNLVEADWQNLPESVPNDYFDLVVTECGIFIWIRNLDAWMRNAYKVLKNCGELIVSDFHPISIIAELKGDKVAFRRSYFDETPEVCDSEDTPKSIEFRWKLSDIINAAIQAGFRVNRVEEFYVEEPAGIPFIPNNFLLVATKELRD
jgi:ubiquinone/menaquinone biosynthesis C-methylase UbiE